VKQRPEKDRKQPGPSADVTSPDPVAYFKAVEEMRR